MPHGSGADGRRRGDAFNDCGIVNDSGGSTEAIASTGTRRFAANLAADVAGYSWLMGADEQGSSTA